MTYIVSPTRGLIIACSPNGSARLFRYRNPETLDFFIRAHRWLFVEYVAEYRAFVFERMADSVQRSLAKRPRLSKTEALRLLEQEAA